MKISGGFGDIVANQLKNKGSYLYRAFAYSSAELFDLRDKVTVCIDGISANEVYKYVTSVESEKESLKEFFWDFDLSGNPSLDRTLTEFVVAAAIQRLQNNSFWQAVYDGFPDRRNIQKRRAFIDILEIFAKVFPKLFIISNEEIEIGLHEISVHLGNAKPIPSRMIKADREIKSIALLVNIVRGCVRMNRNGLAKELSEPEILAIVAYMIRSVGGTGLGYNSDEVIRERLRSSFTRKGLQSYSLQKAVDHFMTRLDINESELSPLMDVVVSTLKDIKLDGQSQESNEHAIDLAIVEISQKMMSSKPPDKK